MNTVEKVIAAFGSPRSLAQALGVDTTTVWRWTQPKPRGTGGYIPRWRHDAILKAARKRGLAITADSLGGRYGRTA